MEAAYGITAQQKQLLSFLTAGETLSTSLLKVADALRNLSFGQENAGIHKCLCPHGSMGSSPFGNSSMKYYSNAPAQTWLDVSEI